MFNKVLESLRNVDEVALTGFGVTDYNWERNQRKRITLGVF